MIYSSFRSDSISFTIEGLFTGFDGPNAETVNVPLWTVISRAEAGDDSIIWLLDVASGGHYITPLSINESS